MEGRVNFSKLKKIDHMTYISILIESQNPILDARGQNYKDIGAPKFSNFLLGSCVKLTCNLDSSVEIIINR